MADRAQIDAKITGDASGFNNAIDGASRKASGFATGVLKQVGGAIAAAFTVGAIINFGRNMLRMADDMQTAATTFDISLEKLVAFKNVMAESGIGADKFMKIFAKMVYFLGEAKGGIKTYTDALDKMGISLEEIEGLRSDQFLELLAEKGLEAGYSMEFLEGITKGLGVKTGPIFIEVLKRMSEGMAKYADEAERVAEGIKKMADASDFFEKKSSAIENFFFIILDYMDKWRQNLVEIHSELSAINPLFAYFVSRTTGLGAIESAKQAIEPWIEAAKNIHMLTEGKISPDLQEEIDFIMEKFSPTRKIRLGFDRKGGPTAISGTPEYPEEDEATIRKRERAEAKWFALKEKSLLRQMEIAEKIEYYEVNVAKLREAQIRYPGDFEIMADRLKNEEILAKLVEKQTKETKKLNEEKKKLLDYIKEELRSRDEAMVKAGQGIEPGMRFNELARMGGQIGGAINVEVGNAIRQLTVSENQLAVQRASDIKLATANALLQDIKNKKDKVTAVLGD